MSDDEENHSVRSHDNENESNNRMSDDEENHSVRSHDHDNESNNCMSDDEENHSVRSHDNEPHNSLPPIEKVTDTCTFSKKILLPTGKATNSDTRLFYQEQNLLYQQYNLLVDQLQSNPSSCIPIQKKLLTLESKILQRYQKHETLMHRAIKRRSDEMNAIPVNYKYIPELMQHPHLCGVETYTVLGTLQRPFDSMEHLNTYVRTNIKPSFLGDVQVWYMLTKSVQGIWKYEQRKDLPFKENGDMKSILYIRDAHEDNPPHPINMSLHFLNLWKQGALEEYAAPVFHPFLQPNDNIPTDPERAPFLNTFLGYKYPYDKDYKFPAAYQPLQNIQEKEKRNEGWRGLYSTCHPLHIWFLYTYTLVGRIHPGFIHLHERIAYIIQHPRNISATIVTFAGKKGCCKDSFFEFLKEIIGFPFIDVLHDIQQLKEGEFNDHKGSVLFQVLNEIDKATSKACDNFLKFITASKQHTVNGKFKKKVDQAKYVSYWAMSNEVGSTWKVEEATEERRLLPYICNNMFAGPDHIPFWTLLNNIMSDETTKRSLFDFYTHLNVDHFEPRDRPAWCLPALRACCKSSFTHIPLTIIAQYFLENEGAFSTPDATLSKFNLYQVYKDLHTARGERFAAQSQIQFSTYLKNLGLPEKRNKDERSWLFTRKTITAALVRMYKGDEKSTIESLLDDDEAVKQMQESGNIEDYKYLYEDDYLVKCGLQIVAQ